MSQHLAADLLTELQAPEPPTPTTPQRTTPRHRADPPPAIGDPVVVPPAAPGARATLLETLRRRMSVRFYAPTAIAAGVVADLIGAGLDADAALWPDAGGETFEATVLAFRVAGLVPGIYRYERAGRRFLRIADLPGAAELFNLTLQQEFCRSAAIISLGADLQAHAEARGAHGYRRVAGRAGAAAYTMWLESVAAGLVGSVFAGFIPASVRRPLRSDGAARHQMFALAIGAPPAPSDVQRQSSAG